MRAQALAGRLEQAAPGAVATAQVARRSAPLAPGEGLLAGGVAMRDMGVEDGQELSDRQMERLMDAMHEAEKSGAPTFFNGRVVAVGSVVDPDSLAKAARRAKFVAAENKHVMTDGSRTIARAPLSTRISRATWPARWAANCRWTAASAKAPRSSSSVPESLRARRPDRGLHRRRRGLRPQPNVEAIPSFGVNHVGISPGGNPHEGPRCCPIEIDSGQR